MTAIVEHWVASCLIISTAGFWALIVVLAWRNKLI